VTFEEFLAARLGPLLRYATVVTCDPHLAQDVTQEVLIRVQARWTRISRLEAPEPYVRRMILNEFLSWRRRGEARRTRSAGWTMVDRADIAQGDAEGRVDDRDLLLRLLAALPPRQRAVIALRYYEDLSDDQIADLMHCRPVTVRTQASRALTTLRRAMPLALPSVHGGIR
jgi:RNA polymerase sigma-70 factor (sigma-E family)